LDDASGRDVTRVAQTWITEPGHPLVELARDKDGRVALRQRRFFLDPDAPASDQRWPIPLLVRTPSGETRALLDAPTGSLELAAAAWIHPNARAAGFYRFSLDGDLRTRLLDHVDELDASERLLLLDNDWALTRAGMLRARGDRRRRRASRALSRARPGDRGSRAAGGGAVPRGAARLSRRGGDGGDDRGRRRRDDPRPGPPRHLLRGASERRRARGL